MPKLFEITDAYTPEETIDGLPVEPVLPTERSRVIINTAEFDKPKSDPLWDDVEGFKNKVKSGVSGIGDAIKYASELDQKFTSSIVNFPKKAYENSDDLVKGIKNLFGLGEEERYQLWPEKVVREALTSAGDIAKPNPYPEGSEQWQFYENKRQEGMVPAAMAISALAGSGGLAGTGAKAGEVALGATPFLRPALKHKDRLYKGKPGQEHQDIIPKELYEDFSRKAMSGEDLAEYNFGFINDKGHFLDREKALKYGIDTGIIDPHSGKFGALTTTLMADSSKPGVAIEAMAKTANPFYSAVEHTVKNIPQAKMTGEQWLGTIANKPGVKPEELDWTGLKGFLEENKGKTVTKAQIENHLAEDKIKLNEVWKGDPVKVSFDDALSAHNQGMKIFATEKGNPNSVFNIYNDKGEILPYVLNNKDKYDFRLGSSADFEAGRTGTKYHSYQLPGGENYREMLLTLPKTEQGLIAKPEGNKGAWNVYDKSGAKIAENLNPSMSEKEAIAFSTRHNNAQYRSSHWDEPNILAHVRMNDRTIDGKKSLHLEEIQSDWHQQGRDKGYGSKKDLPKFEELNKQLTEARKNLENIMFDIRKEHGLNSAEDSLRQVSDRELRAKMVEQRSNAYNASDKYKDALAEVKRLEQATVDANPVGKIPDAPFKKSWHELALKRMIREAAEKGYDRLSWTPGEAQAARYDLSKSVDKIAVPMVSNSGFSRSVRIDGKDGTSYKLMVDANGKVEGQLSAGQFTGKKLDEVVGIEMADKIMKLDKPHEFSGEGLKIGGEGMKGFYDQMIPKYLEKLGKEHGVKVKKGDLKKTNFEIEKTGDEFTIKGDPLNQKFKTKEQAQGIADIMAKSEPSIPTFYIDIPQSLKDTAMKKGFPLFSASPGYMFVPFDGDPFENKK